jgi:ADP-heptose:LPS heptosyltransferase
MSLLESIPEGGSVVILRLRSMGDCILTTPAIALLKDYRPDLAIHLVVDGRFQEVFAGNPSVDSIATPGIRNVRRMRPQLLINFHGGTKSAQLAALSGAGKRAGFQHYRNRWVYNVVLPRAQEVFGFERKVHTAEHLASAMFFLGVPQKEIPSAQLFPVGDRKPSGTVVLHPAASDLSKKWPAECFLELAAQVAKEYSLEPVFVGANEEELRYFQKYRILAGLPLRELMAVIRDCSMYVGNDSGPAHIAAAFDRPGVVLFGESDAVVWAPWKTKGLRAIQRQPLSELGIEEVWEALSLATQEMKEAQ